MALPETTRHLRAKNLAKATELKGNVLDLMKQTVDHCQSLKETASIAVKVRLCSWRRWQEASMEFVTNRRQENGSEPEEYTHRDSILWLCVLS